MEISLSTFGKTEKQATERKSRLRRPEDAPGRLGAPDETEGEAEVLNSDPATSEESNSVPPFPSSPIPPAPRRPDPRARFDLPRHVLLLRLPPPPHPGPRPRPSPTPLPQGPPPHPGVVRAAAAGGPASAAPGGASRDERQGSAGRGAGGGGARGGGGGAEAAAGGSAGRDGGGRRRLVRRPRARRRGPRRPGTPARRHPPTLRFLPPRSKGCSLRGFFFPVPNQLANACFFRRLQRSGTVPGVGLVHAPFSLLPARLPESFWKQACELAPIFNELVDRVSLDGEFLQAALSRQVLNYYTELFRQPCICLFSA
jgi:hypothetical protein